MRRNELFYIVVFGSGSAAGKESVRERERERALTEKMEKEVMVQWWVMSHNL